MISSCTSSGWSYWRVLGWDLGYGCLYLPHVNVLMIERQHAMLSLSYYLEWLVFLHFSRLLVLAEIRFDSDEGQQQQHMFYLTRTVQK